MYTLSINLSTAQELLAAIKALGATDTEVTVAASPVPIAAPEVTPIAPVVPLASAPEYTADQLAKAGADLVVKNPALMANAQALLAQFGVAAVTELPRDRYGDFATALRGIGATI